MSHTTPFGRVSYSSPSSSQLSFSYTSQFHTRSHVRQATNRCQGTSYIGPVASHSSAFPMVPCTGISHLSIPSRVFSTHSAIFSAVSQGASNQFSSTFSVPGRNLEAMRTGAADYWWLQYEEKTPLPYGIPTHFSSACEAPDGSLLPAGLCSLLRLPPGTQWGYASKLSEGRMKQEGEEREAAEKEAQKILRQKEAAELQQQELAETKRRAEQELERKKAAEKEEERKKKEAEEEKAEAAARAKAVVEKRKEEKREKEEAEEKAAAAAKAKADAEAKAAEDKRKEEERKKDKAEKRAAAEAQANAEAEARLRFLLAATEKEEEEERNKKEAGSEEAARGRMQTGAENTAARLAAVESEEAAAEAASALEATEAGVGLLFHGSGTARWAVKTIIPGSPAFLSGKIEEGDVLRAIGGDVVSDMETLKELSKHIMGRALHTCAEDTEVLLRFEKDGVASGMGSEYEVLLRRSTAFLGDHGKKGRKSKRSQQMDANMDDTRGAVDL